MQAQDCEKYVENIEYLVSGCLNLTLREYKDRGQIDLQTHWMVLQCTTCYIHVNYSALHAVYMSISVYYMLYTCQLQCTTCCMHVNYSVLHAEQSYEHYTEPVIEGHKVNILWDFTVHIERNIKTNRPDITIKDNEQKMLLYLISVIVIR